MSSTLSNEESAGSKVNVDLVQDIMSQLEERNLLQHDSSKRHYGGLKESKSRSASMLQVLRKNRLKSAKKPRKSASLSLLCGLSRSKTLENLRKSGNIPKSRAAKFLTSTPDVDEKMTKPTVLCAVQGSTPGLNCDCSPVYQLASASTSDKETEPLVQNVFQGAQCRSSLRSAMKYKAEDALPTDGTADGTADGAKRVRIRSSPENIRTPYHKSSKEDKDGVALMRLDAGHTPRLIRKKENFRESLI